MRWKTFGLFTLSTLALWAAARGPARAADEPARGGAVDVKAVPADTYEAHMARAEEYSRKAAAYRAEAEAHHKMFADYQARERIWSTRAGVELPWVRKARKHCEAYWRKAERLSEEAEGFARFHRRRAEEARGK